MTINFQLRANWDFITNYEYKGGGEFLEDLGNWPKQKNQKRKEKQTMPNPFPLEVEESLPMFAVSCTAKVFEVAGHTPTTILRTDQQWGVEFDWAASGDLNYILGGRWALTVLLEKMGVGEFNLPHNTQNVPFFSAPHNYTSSMVWNPGEVPVGQYRLVSTILMYGPGGVPGPICLSGDGPLLTFYSSPLP